MSKIKTQYTYITGKDGITIYANGSSYTVASGHTNYDKILKVIKKGKPESKLLDLIDTKKAITSFCSGVIDIKGGVLLYEGLEMNNSLTMKILQMMEEGFDITPMANFLTKLKANPSRTAQQELYDFLEAGDLPLTPEGNFLAYKSVNSNYRDYHSGKFDNSIGAICEMPRNAVCDDRNITCSHGLHFAQKSYAESFGRGGHLMMLQIDPGDVVSIPRDYNNTKGRCAKYEVIGEVAYTKGSDEFVEKSIYVDPKVVAEAEEQTYDTMCYECGTEFDYEECYEDEEGNDCCPYCGEPV